MEREKKVYHGTALHPHTILRYTGINTGKLLGYRVYPWYSPRTILRYTGINTGKHCTG